MRGGVFLKVMAHSQFKKKKKKVLPCVATKHHRATLIRIEMFVVLRPVFARAKKAKS